MLYIITTIWRVSKIYLTGCFSALQEKRTQKEEKEEDKEEEEEEKGGVWGRERFLND